MAFHLEMIGGLEPGRRIPIWADRPRVFQIVRQGLDAGVVEVAVEAGQCVVRNCSLRPVLVNGAICPVATLHDGDQLVIGKDEFRVIGSEGRQVLCFLCDAPCLVDDGRLGNEDHLCTVCLAAGASPAEASRPEIEVIEPPPAVATPSRPISERRRRAISATMPATIASRPTLLTRLSSVFSQRQKRHREEQLRQERRDLLEELGRLCVSGGLFGLDEQALAALQSGKGVVIAADAQPRKPLDRWRLLRERVTLIDAEIATIRQQLGLGADPEAAVLGRMELRAGTKCREDRVYAALDAMETQEVPQVVMDELPSAHR